MHGLGIPDWSIHDHSANPIGLEQSWPRKPLISGSTRSAVCREPVLLAGLGKWVHLGTSPLGPVGCPSPWAIPQGRPLNIHTYIDNKWLDDDTKIKPGDVVILKPEYMEKNQWRLARILNIHKTKDGEYDSASIG